MQTNLLIMLAGGAGIFLIVVVGMALMVKSFYLKVSPGQALINNKTGNTIGT